MKKFVITEEEKKQIRSTYEDRFLMEGDSIKFLLRRWDTFKKHFDSEFEISAICHFKEGDDFSGYLKHVSRSIAKSMFLNSGNFINATEEEYYKFVDFGSEAIIDNFKDEIEKHYELKEC
jgi:hypothetical protein